MDLFFKVENGLVHISNDSDFSVSDSEGYYTGGDTLSIAHSDLKLIMDTLRDHEGLK